MTVQLRQDDVLILKGASAFDPEELGRAVEPFGFEVFITTRFALVKAEVQRLLVEKGISYVWQLARLREAVLPRTSNRAPLVAALQGMLSRLTPAQELVVVDRYLLPKSPAGDYLNTLASLLEPLAGRLERFVLVTSENFDAQMLSAIDARLRRVNPDCSVSHRVSDSFHDRFWIADQAKGLIVGTSLNGIGRRYAVVDYMQPSDVREIVAALKQEGLL